MHLLAGKVRIGKEILKVRELNSTYWWEFTYFAWNLGEMKRGAILISLRSRPDLLSGI
jgi:hypothetical protein